MKQLLTKQINEAIDRWWDAFIGSEFNISGYFENKTDFDIIEFMQNNLKSIHKSLNWEFGPAISKKGHRLIITPENRKDLRPLVKVILGKAPALPKWEFYAYRLPENYKSAKEIVEAKTGLFLTEMYFIGEKNRFNTIDLTFISLFAKESGALKTAKYQAFYLVESLLGEEVLDKWIGAIEIETHLPENEKHMPLSELCTWVTNQINEIKNSLPDKPFYERMKSEMWTLYKLEPEEKDKYPRQEDMFVGKTMCVPVWENIKSNCSFCSERYSKIGEIFCYIKIENGELEKEDLDSYSHLENILDQELMTAELGCCIGGGTGLQYSYIDLALIDVDNGIAIVKDLLRKENVPKNTWIHFFDSERESEWIGIWDDTPIPPMPDFEGLN